MTNRVGFTCSCFDLFHAGHVSMLEEAKQHCDHLIVGLHSNPSTCNSNKNEPVQSLVERQIQVRACKYIDEIIVYETEEDLELQTKFWRIFEENIKTQNLKPPLHGKINAKFCSKYKYLEDAIK